VQPQDGAVAFEHRNEQAATLDLLQKLGSAWAAADGGAAAGSQLRQHRAAQEKLAQLLRHLLEHFAGEVVDQVPPALPFAHPVDRARAGRRVDAQPHAGRPSLGAVVQAPHSLGVVRSHRG
jgi:hypothetical protein